MGTNYYAIRKKPCLYGRVIHIGKSSCGWMFLFQDCDEFHTYPQFKKWLDREVPNEYVLFDEYNQEVSKEELLELIDIKQKESKNNPENFDYEVKNIDGYRFTDRDFG